MGHAGGFDHVAAAIELVIPGISVGLQNAFERAEMILRMLALAIRRVAVKHRGWIGATEGSIVADIGPKPGFSGST